MLMPAAAIACTWLTGVVRRKNAASYAAESTRSSASSSLRAQPGVLDRRDVEGLAQRAGEGLLRLRRRVADEAVGGEDGQARILERNQAHEDVAVGALAADLLRVDAGGLVAVVAVGDEQLRVVQRRLGGRDRV